MLFIITIDHMICFQHAGNIGVNYCIVRFFLHILVFESQTVDKRHKLDLDLAQIC